MRSINYCLNKKLADICGHALKLEFLNDKVFQFLPIELSSLCKVSNFNKGCLVLSTSNAACASQLRYFKSELRDKLRTEAGLYQLRAIEIVINPSPIYLNKSAKEHRYSLSDNAKSIIINESRTCTYEPLKKALFNLASEVDPTLP